MKNTVGRERLAKTELEVAQNVDLDDVGQARRRRGYTLKLAGNFHSAWTSASGTVYVAKNQILGILYPNYTWVSLGVFVGMDRISYCQIADRVFFSSMQVSGIIERNGTISPWGAPDAPTEWFSHVLNPTATLGAVGGRLLSAPPLASVIMEYNGRMYLARKNVVWVTELYLYEKIDRTLGFWQFEADVTVMGSVSDGCYIGTTEACYWVGGNTFREANRTPVSQYGAMPGSLVYVPAELLIPDQRRPATISKNAVMWLTESGLMVGFDNGVANALTQDMQLLPTARDVASLFRRQDGVNQYVGVLDSGGTPTSTARIGDYVDVEIRRFQGA